MECFHLEVPVKARWIAVFLKKKTEEKTTTFHHGEPSLSQ